METDFTSGELNRYSRQMPLPQVGAKGQGRLKQARVLIVGAGGLGAPVALYLAAAGVGHITLMDGDRVELSNLQRQIIFTGADVGRAKAEVAAQRLREQNTDIAVSAVCEALTLDNAATRIAAADLVMDCCDNFPTRYLINDFCRHLGKPWLFAAVHQFRGHFALFTTDTACFRCLYPETPLTEGNCSLAGVIGTVPGLLGLWQANEALKYLLQLPESRPGRLWSCDVLSPAIKGIELVPDPECWCAQRHPEPRALQTPELATDDLELGWRDWQVLTANHSQALLIDIRSEEEHRRGNAGGVWLAGDAIPARLAQLDNDQPVGLYCQRGQRSLALVRTLRARGFTRVFSIRGGLEKWQHSSRNGT